MRYRVTGIVFSLLLIMANGTIQAEDRPPNFVFILVDDLGYMDIGANNPETFYETPNVDRLAREGMRFTQGYAANPVCSPTRYSIMTGRFPTRVDATNFFSGRREGRFRPAPLNDVMPLEEVTLAEALKEKGYRTAFLGKWHLGPTEDYWPEAQGFDINIGGHDRGSPPGGYFAPFKNPKLEDGPKGQHLTTRLTDESLNVLEQLHEDPFLMYLAFYTVHTPLQAPKDLVEKYQAKAKAVEASLEFAPEEQNLPDAGERRVRIVQKHPTYAAMIETMDTSVGRILNKLQDLGVAENTVVCFFSDNGGLSTSEGSPTSNLPLRGGKGWLYEGGVREPMIIKWPGQTSPGSVCDEPVMSIDFLPTLLEIAGTSPPTGRKVDGVSLVPLLKGADQLPERPLFWHYPHYSNQGGFPGGAIRDGDWKLLERLEDGRVHLYNIANDISEQTDLATEKPEMVQKLRRQLHAWYKDVDAKFLQAKPNGPEPWRP
ncbi:MAG: sulfatase [Planctomycetaceae bacterium]|nr:sulfatase [Planctomycetaceae bacterium]